MTVVAEARIDDVNGRRIRSEKIALAQAFSALLVTLVCRLAIWFAPSASAFWSFDDLLRALAACFQDVLVILVILLLHLATLRIFDHSRVVTRRVIHLTFAGIYFLTRLVLVANVLSLTTTGTMFEFYALSYLFTNKIYMVATILPFFFTNSKVIFLALCLVIVPVLVHVAAQHFANLRFAHCFAAAVALAVSTGALSGMLTEQADRFAQVYKTRNPIVSQITDVLWPSTMRKQLEGEENIDPEAAALIGPHDWLPPPVVDHAACCKGMSIVLVTIDSVPQNTLSRAQVLANKDRYPNLAKLYRRSLAFDRFYANYPSSTETNGVMTGSVYASNTAVRTSVTEWTGRDVATLPRLLHDNGYVTAHFMSGDLRYDGVKEFFKEQKFSTLHDSYDLTCGAEHALLRSVYTHIGDECIASAAAQWIVAGADKPSFLWVWFSNAHAPYFVTGMLPTRTDRRSKARQELAIRELDAALGTVLTALEQKNKLEKTIIILHSDHGEAFGEHGTFFHGSSLYEEQVHIPFLISAPGLPQDQATDVLGSTIDFAPTVAAMVGLQAPPTWQGRNLLSEQKPERAYFTALSAGRMAGYREGDRKYILSSLDDQPYFYDLRNDPEERSPQQLSGMEARIVAARLNAFIRHRNGLRWPPATQ